MTEIQRGAILSECQRYRYHLWRAWGPGTRVLFVMLNPSTADASQDDPTIRRCIGFARTLGFDGLDVCNLFALRATKPRDLFADPSPVGPENDEHLERVASTAGRIVAAWGAHGWYGGRGAIVLDHLRRRGHVVHCLGLTQEGHPRHPLYLPRDAQLVPMGAP